MGIAGNLCVARRRRCAPASTSSSRLELASQAPCARHIVILGQTPSPHFSQDFEIGGKYKYLNAKVRKAAGNNYKIDMI